MTGFIGASLPTQAALYSKAGFTSQVRHDSAYVEIPGHHPFTLVIFTEGREHSKNREIIPYLTQRLVEQTRI